MDSTVLLALSFQEYPKVLFWDPCCFYYIFINDISNSILCTLRLYADDVLLYITIYSINDCKRLQQDLVTLERWASAWQMEFNLSKCEHLSITNKKSFVLYDYQLCGQVIQKSPA